MSDIRAIVGLRKLESFSLRNPVEKDVAEPCIVFVDINLPELNMYKNEDKIDKIINEYKKLETSHLNHKENKKTSQLQHFLAFGDKDY